MHVTANIHHSLAPKGHQLLNELVITAFPWRINNENRAVWGELPYSCENICSVACAERAFALRNVVQTSVVRCELDGVGGELDPCNDIKVLRECDSEEAAPAICVDQMCWTLCWGVRGRRSGREDGITDIFS